MRAFLALITETLLTLKRDKLFIPSVIAGILTTALAAVVGFWGMEEFQKILFDLGGLGYQLIGVVVALFWGTKMISDSRQSGYWEVQLAAPVHRTTWLLAKFFGLILSLAVLAVIFVAIWHLVLWYFDLKPFFRKEWTIFGMMTLGWFLMASIAVFFASLTSQALALFCSLALWVTGLTSASIANALSPETPAFLRFFVEGIARYWNLHVFNLIDFASSKDHLPGDVVQMRFVAGCLLITIFLSLAAIFFSRKDLASS